MAACQRMGPRRPTIRDLGSMPTAETTTTKMTMTAPQQPRPSPSTWFLEDDEADASEVSSDHHFLEECHMCGRSLPWNRDVYMYKGDTPFCSEECRDEQVRIDDHEERACRRRRAAKAANAVAASEGKPSASAEVKSQTAAVAVGAV